MKKILSWALVALLMLGLFAGCAPAKQEPPAPAPVVEPEKPAEELVVVEVEPAPAPDPVELVVFAAASMQEAMEEIATLYKAVAPNVTLVYNFESSGTLKTQIEQGAQCDIFISAGQKQMNELDIKADPAVNTAALDFVLEGSRFNIVSNKVVMIVPEGSTAGISDFADVTTDKVSLIALGNADVPVGQYSVEVYTTLGLWEEIEKSGKVSFGSNVKEVLVQVENASVDCGIVYSTDAATATGVTVVAEAPAGSHKPITYPAAILNITEQQEAAEAFIAYLKDAEATAVLESIGFAPPQ